MSALTIAKKVVARTLTAVSGLNITWKNPDLQKETGEYFENDKTKNWLSKKGISFESEKDLIDALSKGHSQVISKEHLSQSVENFSVKDEEFSTEIKETKYSEPFSKMEKALKEKGNLIIESPILLKVGNTFYGFSGNRRANLAWKYDIPVEFWVVQMWRNQNKKKKMALNVIAKINLKGSYKIAPFMEDKPPRSVQVTSFQSNSTQPMSSQVMPFQEISAELNPSNIKCDLEKKQLLSKKSSYPKHPTHPVITKGDRITPGPEILEQDVWNYYDGVKDAMLKELKGREIFLGMKLEGQTGKKPMFIRHPWDNKNAEYIDINTIADFKKYMSGRTVEFHVTLGKSTPYYIVDFDASGEWNDTKKIIGEIADGLDKLPEVKKVTIRYSGKRGFHVLGWLKKPIPIDKAREDLKTWLKEAFKDRGDVVVGESPKGSKGALGVSPMKFHGGQVALWSLRTTGLCCIEVPRAQLMGFKKEDASMEKTYKKLTGKTFEFSSKKKMAGRVIRAFIDQEAALQRWQLENQMERQWQPRVPPGKKKKQEPGKPNEPFAEKGELVTDLPSGEKKPWPHE